MPSNYCQTHPWGICQFNPNYGGSIYNPGTPTWGGNPFPENNPPIYTPPINTPGNPNPTINQGGVTWNSGVYSQTLQAILGGIALFQHQPYIPTTIHPVQQQQQYPIGYNPYAGGQVPAGQNVAGGLQDLLTKHPTAVLAGVVLFGALMLKPPMRR